MVPDGWQETNIGKHLLDATLRNSDGKLLHSDLRAVNKHLGMIPMKDRVKGKTVDRAKIVKKDWFAYNPMRINIGSICRWGNEDDCIVSPDYVVFKCDPATLNTDFFDQFRRSHRWNKFMEDAGRGSVRIRIYLETLKQLKCWLPPLEEQKKIAQILITWDRAIEATQKLITNQESQKSALMQQLLTGKKRLLGFNGSWHVKQVHELGDIITGNTPPRKNINNYGNEVLWATAQDFKQKYISKTCVELSKEGAAYSRIVPKGSILVTCIASIGLNAIAANDLATNQQINSIVPHNEFCGEFIYYIIEANPNELIKRAGTTAVPIINKTNFSKIPFYLPKCKDEQIAISKILSVSDSQLQKLRDKKSLLMKEKLALMQQLFSGASQIKIDKEVQDAKLAS